MSAPVTPGSSNGKPAGLDAEAVRLLLNRRLQERGAGVQFANLALEHGAADPGGDLLALYRGTIVNGAASETQVLFGCVLGAGDDARRFAKAERKLAKGRFVRPALGEAAYHLHEIGMVVWTFPNDPTLKTLTVLRDPARLRPVLARFESRHGWQPGALQSELLRYVPGKRAVFQHDVEWRRPRGPDGAPVGLPASQYERIVVKVYDTRQAANRGWAVLEGVWLTQQGTRHAFRVPRPLHFERELLSVWSTHVPGMRLGAHPEAWNARTVGRIGRGLAALHQARMHLPESVHLDDEAAALRHHAGLIAGAHPEVAGRLDELLDQVMRRLPGLSRLPLVASHGSFTLNHLLADGERIAVVDFDSMVNADPVFDLAHLAAELEASAVHGLLPAARAGELEAACRDAYLAHVPWPARHAVFDWYVACLLVREQAYTCVKQLHADAAQKILVLIDAATRRLRRHDP